MRIAKIEKCLGLMRTLFLVGPVLLAFLSLSGCFASQKGSLIISASPSTAADDLVYSRMPPARYTLSDPADRLSGNIRSPKIWLRVEKKQLEKFG